MHYALLPLPFFVACVVIAGAAIGSRAPLQLRQSNLMRIAAAGLALIAFIRSDEFLSPWPPAFSRMAMVQPIPWRQLPGVDADWNTLRTWIRPGDDVLLLPPRRNEIHFALGTRSVSFEQGYGWALYPEMVEKAIRSPGLQGVFILKKYLDPTDRETWDKLHCDSAIADLPSAGFQLVADLDTMAFWRRE
jgi:hypothetical protein